MLIVFAQKQFTRFPHMITYSLLIMNTAGVSGKAVHMRVTVHGRKLHLVCVVYNFFFFRYLRIHAVCFWSSSHLCNV